MRAVRPPTLSEWQSHRRIVISRATGREHPFDPAVLGPLGRMLLDTYMPALTENIFAGAPAMEHLKRSTC